MYVQLSLIFGFPYFQNSHLYVYYGKNKNLLSSHI